ncbi:MAG: threonine synthase [Spirochaetaceae bacterium]|jgi:threonine synthase|nr:threonine synthase [Spirochaetaceae bacterium]
MNYYSTRNKTEKRRFAQAALGGLAPDGGLYVPETIPALPASVVASLAAMTFAETAFETVRPFVRGDVPDAVLGDIVQSAYPFDAPLVPVGRFSVLELFHGPTAAFKDFGARFMARVFSYLRRGEDRPLTILVATSGDTGGAVADGFFGVEGVSVTVLYPKGRVTPLQEKQIAGLHGNISAVAVEGSFDDCQRLVKEAFRHDGLRKTFDLTSANSINIARLIPQAVYYVAGAGKGARGAISITCAVPSGNFGNLTAGLYAREMGAPIAGFIAATNVNKTVPDYLETGVYETRPSQATISNAMDVGAPSNFERLAAHWSLDELRALMRGVWVTDAETRETIQRVHAETGYTLDPHGAVGWKAAEKSVTEKAATEPPPPIAILETAHPAKFAETVEPIVGKVPLPPSLEKALTRDVESITIPPDIETLVDYLKRRH